MSSVNWDESKVHITPNVATNSLTSNGITIDSSNASDIQTASFVDTKHITMNGADFYEYSGIDYSRAIRKLSSFDVTIPDIDVQGYSLCIALMNDTPKVFDAEFVVESSSSGGAGSHIHINAEDWTEVKFLNSESQYETKYYIQSYITSGAVPRNEKITKISFNIYNGFAYLLTVHDENPNNLVLGCSRLFLYQRPYPKIATINSYASAHHENNMLVLPNLETDSFKTLINSASCSNSDYVINLNSSLALSSTRPFYYFIEVEGDYVIMTDSDPSIIERRYKESDDDVEQISTVKRTLTTKVEEKTYIAHIPANSVLELNGSECLLSKAH